MKGKMSVSAWLSLISGAFVLGGLACIVAYALSTDGPHLQFVGVGLMTALATFVTGYLFGFLFGIPKVVSSGELRHRRDQPSTVTETSTASTTTRTVSVPMTADGISTEVLAAAGGQPAADSDVSSNGDAASRTPDGRAEHDASRTFEPSSNLAEVSDWLTKLLLGAGLVSLTKLGPPLGALIDSVASGLEGSTGAVSGPARTLAGALLIAYTALGFLDGYVVTTLWYGRRIAADVY